MLQQFVAQYGSGLADVALRPGAPGQAQTLRQVRSIKSAAATIAALRLAQLAERLELTLDSSASEAELAAAAQAM